MANFQIKEAKPEELDRFFKFFEKSLRTQFPHYSENTINFLVEKEFSKVWLKSELKTRQSILLIAETNNGHMAGFLVASRPYGGVSFCSWIVVAKEFQGRGVATTLLRKWEKLAQKDGAHKVHLWTDHRNLKFYKKQGYKLAGKITLNYFGATDYLFYKEIQKPREENYLREFLKKAKKK